MSDFSRKILHSSLAGPVIPEPTTPQADGELEHFTIRSGGYYSYTYIYIYI